MLIYGHIPPPLDAVIGNTKNEKEVIRKAALFLKCKPLDLIREDGFVTAKAAEIIFRRLKYDDQAIIDFIILSERVIESSPAHKRHYMHLISRMLLKEL